MLNLTFNYLETVVSQYQNSPRLLALIQNMDQYIDPTANITSFITMVEDVLTAQGYGLDVWGRIVGVNRVLTVSTSKYLGFKEGGTTDYDPFDQSPFWAGVPATGNYTLSDAAFRLYILTKGLANISDGSIPALNQVLLNLFPGRGNCYVIENSSMHITYNFNFVLQPFELSIVLNIGGFMKPVGVTLFITHL